MTKTETILCPTDFSENASHAFHFAQLLAEKCGATVELMHVYHIPLHLADVGAEPRGPQVRPEDISLQLLAIRIAQRVDNIPVAALDVGIDGKEKLALAVDVCAGRRSGQHRTGKQYDEAESEATEDGSG